MGRWPNEGITDCRAWQKSALKSQGKSNLLFQTLKKGDFPKNGSIRGASVIFWQSWLEASRYTLPDLFALKTPVLLLLSNHDDFLEARLLKNIEKSPSNRLIKLKYYSDSDRNFRQR